jgi:hypothetical protein
LLIAECWNRAVIFDCDSGPHYRGFGLKPG